MPCPQRNNAMININKKTVRFMLLAVAVISVAIGAFRTVILANFLEPETGFYVKDTNIDVWFAGVVVLAVAMILAFGFFMRKTKAPEYLDSRSMVVVFTSALCIFMYFSVFAYGAYTIFTSEHVSLFLYAEVALCIPCCLNHVTICSKEIREKNSPHALLSMSEAIFFAIRTVECFMDVETQINASQRSLELLMLSSMMLFFMCESGFMVDREESATSVSLYSMAAFGSVAFTFISLIPFLIVSFVLPVYETEFVFMSILDCCVMLFAASRIVTMKNQNI